MLSITATTPAQTYAVLSGKTYYPVRIEASITDTSDAVTYVGATLDWNDGTPLVVFDPAKPLTIDTTRNLTIGTYYITLTGYNYLHPTPERTSVYFNIEVQPRTVIPPEQEYLFGPILPSDNGFPNAEQWNFNTGVNLEVLKSSVKMLLITTKGERIMQPTYGTLLRRIVFDPSTNSTSSVIQQEITEALAQFEPRVSLQSFSVDRVDSGGRSLLVNAVFMSKVSQSTFSLAIPFSQ